MIIETLRHYCLSLPHATEGVQGDSDLLFRLGGKMFAVTNLDGTPTKVSFKCTPEKFDELIESAGIIPAPYLARNKWVMVERLNALNDKELKALIKHSYDMLFAKLPKKIKTTLITRS
ncbi:MAG: MmcQ/YjbR family DNA-binding protein [Acidobacteriota bacterium]